MKRHMIILLLVAVLALVGCVPKCPDCVVDCGADNAGDIPIIIDGAVDFAAGSYGDIYARSIAVGETTPGSTVGGGDGFFSDDLEIDGTLNADGGATIDGGVTNIGGGTPDVAAGDNDLYVTADLEVDGALDADSTANIAGVLTLQGLLLSSGADLTVTDGYTLTPTVTTYNLDSAGAVTMTLAASGTEWQLLILVGDDANDITINDTNLRSNDGAAQVLNAYDVLMLVYIDSEWVEISESNDS